MKFLLDTNAVSEISRPQINAGVAAWLDEVELEATFLSVISWAELRFGVASMAAGDKRRRLAQWLEAEIPALFFGRMLPVSIEVAEAWGVLMAERVARGRPISAMDAMLAATAVVHNLTFVTRNTKDFEGSVARLVNPWT